MKILLCVKQVPDTADIRIDPVKNVLIRKGVPSILNPFDSYALEAAARIKDKDRLPVYLMRCTVNAARAELRKRRKTEPLDDYRDTLAAPDSGSPIREYVSGLKEKYRMPLILTDGMTDAWMANVKEATDCLRAAMPTLRYSG